MEGPAGEPCKAGNFPVSLEASFRSIPISEALFEIPPCQRKVLRKVSNKTKAGTEFSMLM